MKRTMKKALGLVLCLAMMLSVMVIGAGAAFSDHDMISNAEAVDGCVALNIIGGYPDGSFKPEGNVTRAQMCKIICVALNGGKEPTFDSDKAPSFADAANNWAKSYIAYCADLGIVSGVGSNKFNPDGDVTAAQAAKMLLVALGYNADKEGFTGPFWTGSVSIRATQAGLFGSLDTIDVKETLTRDKAAQMIWNALNACEVEYVTETVTDDNGQTATKVVLKDKIVAGSNDRLTLIKDKYGVDKPAVK